MMRDAPSRFLTLSEPGWAAAPLAISCLMLPLPAQAQARPQIELQGYVAPRCWVVNSARVVCNQSRPQLQSHLRTLRPDGTLVQYVSSEIAGRAAREIIVSPQL